MVFTMKYAVFPANLSLDQPNDSWDQFEIQERKRFLRLRGAVLRLQRALRARWRDREQESRGRWTDQLFEGIVIPKRMPKRVKLRNLWKC